MMKKRVFDDNYEDIINLPHHTSPTRQRMSRENRAAQFSPFAALTGHAEAIKETERLSAERAELEDCERIPFEEFENNYLIEK